MIAGLFNRSSELNHTRRDRPFPVLLQNAIALVLCELHGHHHSKLALATASVHPGKIKQAQSPSLQKLDTLIFTLNKKLTITSQCSTSQLSSL